MPTLAPPKKILTVDDNAIVSADVRAILEGAGYDVCPDARDGVQAVEHVRAYEPDLILLDLKLPRMDGVEAASLIREESDAPILVLTGYWRLGAARARRGRGNERPGAQAVQRARTALGGPYPSRRSATPRTSACAAWSSRCCATAPARRRSSARSRHHECGDSRTRAQGRPGLRSIVRALTRRRVRAL